jgi:hypothetical protein
VEHELMYFICALDIPTHPLTHLICLSPALPGGSSQQPLTLSLGITAGTTCRAESTCEDTEPVWGTSMSNRPQRMQRAQGVGNPQESQGNGREPVALDSTMLTCSYCCS